MHRQDAHLVAAPNNQVATMAGLKGATLLLQPPFELIARHPKRIQQSCCVCNKNVVTLLSGHR